MIKVKILDRDWKFYILSEDSFQRRFGEHDSAVTLPDSREVFFCTDHLAQNVVFHEVWHVYRATMLTQSASITPEQEEEISAEMFSEYGNKMIRMSRILYKELRDEDGQ